MIYVAFTLLQSYRDLEALGDMHLLNRSARPSFEPGPLAHQAKNLNNKPMPC